MITCLKEISPLKIEFSLSIKEAKRVYIRNRQVRNNNLDIEIKEISEDKFTGILDLTLTKSWFLTTGFFDVVVVLKDGKEHFVSMEQCATIDDVEYQLNNIFLLKPYKNLNGNLSFKSYTKIKVQEKTIDKRDNTLDFSFELPFEEVFGVYLLELELVDNQEIYQFATEAISSKELCFSVDVNSLGEGIPIYFKTDQPIVNYLVRIYYYDEASRTKTQLRITETDLLKKNQKDTMLTIKQDFSGYELADVRIENNIIVLNVASDNPAAEIYIKKRNDFLFPVDGTVFVKLDKAEMTYSLKLEEIKLEFNLNEDRIFDFYYVEKHHEKTFMKNLLLNETFEKETVVYQDRSFDIYQTRDLSLALAIKKNPPEGAKDSGVKVGVIGSSFSRMPFTSKEYFNPNSVDKYEIVDTIFHSTLASLLSQPLEGPNCQLLEVENKVIRRRMEREFNKDFFQKMKQRKIDFLIIDFFGDVNCELIKFDDNHYVTNNNQMKKYKIIEKIGIEGEIIPVDNWEYRRLLLIKLLPTFIKTLKEIIPEERIVLMKIAIPENYYTKDGKEERYNPEVIQNIKQLNKRYNLVEDLFIDHLPKAKIINLANGKFIADNRYPDGPSINHFESAYYKEFMTRLDTIVIRELAKRKKRRRKK